MCIVYQSNFNILSIIFLSFFLNLFLFNFNTFEFISKLSLDENYVNCYFFFWTNFWFIPICFLLITQIFFCFTNATQKNMFYRFFVIFFILFANETLCMNLSNQNYIFVNFLNDNLNLFLLNNLNKYHPIFFFLNICLYIYIYILFLTFIYKNNFYFYNEFYFFILIKILFLLFCCVFTFLCLGSWWAIQENSWGGWWSWDFSENLGLFFLPIFFYFFHANYNLYFLNFFSFSFSLFSFLMYTYYFCVQFNFDTTLHNFGIKFYFFFDGKLTLFISSLVFFLLLIVLILFQLWSLNNFFFLKKSKILFNYKINFKVSNLCYFFIFLIFFFFWFFDFFFDFFFNNFLINFFTNKIFFFRYVLIFLFFLILPFFIAQNLILKNAYSFPLLIVFFIPIFFINYFNVISLVQHIFFLYFFFNNLISTNLFFFLWKIQFIFYIFYSKYFFVFLTQNFEINNVYYFSIFQFFICNFMQESSCLENVIMYLNSFYFFLFNNMNNLLNCCLYSSYVSFLENFFVGLVFLNIWMQFLFIIINFFI